MAMPEVQGAPDARGGTRTRLSTGSELAFAAQFIVAGAVFLATSGMRDDHGLGIGSAVFAAIPLMLLAVVLAAYLHRVLFVLPVMALTRPLGSPWWAVPWAAVITAGYTLWAGSGLDLPYGWTALWIAGPGVLPVAAASYAHHRSLGWTGMAARVGAVTGIALLVCGVGAFLQERTGFAAYEPPRLERDRYVGQWIGDGGARKLRLSENGEAVADNMPLADPNAGPWDMCSGTGTWKFEPKRESGGLFHRGPRDRVTLTIPGCGRLDAWQVAGTAERPELFCVIGDPDDLHPRYAVTLHRV
ncbi:hypothetical protein [Streptomyces sp. NBC_01006]|uniref:hypothetical protein n=1 Tax=Streptomyces sp. NBC_01006 TaxID=2903716 RepID=UPI0038656743|nr:hypothetical protein OG509_16655 [Streptomyces sp. NBC_01006]